MTVVEAIFILEPTRTGPREGSEMTPDFDQAVTKQQGANPNSPEAPAI